MDETSFCSYSPQGVFEGAAKYKEKNPSKPFKHLVAFYNQFIFDSCPDSSQYTAIPSGCTDIKFYCHSRKPKVFVCGSKKRNELSNLPCDSHALFGIRFWPGQFFKIFPFHSETFTNIEVDLESVTLHPIHEVVDKILEAQSFQERIQLWEAFLVSWMDRLTTIPPWVDATIQMILNSRGDIDVSKLSDRIGYTDRHIRREFNRVVGISPKLFSRIIKFQNVLQGLQQEPSKPLAEVAQKFGYFDQSHFSHEFKGFYGKTPLAVLPHPSDRSKIAESAVTALS